MLRQHALALATTVKTLAGFMVATLLAILLTVASQGRAWNVFVPLLFTIVVVGVTMLFGRLAGLLGLASASMIFAYRLFAPVHSFKISDPTAANNLAAMILAGLILSQFLLEPRGPSQRA